MFKIALKYGVLIVLFSLIWIGLEYLVGLQTDYVEFHPLVTLLTLVVPLLFMYYGIREAKRSSPAPFTYGDGFKAGVAIAIVVAILNPLVQWLSYTLVFPGYFETLQANAEAQQLALGVDLEVARQQAGEEYNLQNYLWQAFMGTLVGGIVIAAIFAIFFRDKAVPEAG